MSSNSFSSLQWLSPIQEPLKGMGPVGLSLFMFMGSTQKYLAFVRCKPSGTFMVCISRCGGGPVGRLADSGNLDRFYPILCAGVAMK